MPPFAMEVNASVSTTEASNLIPNLRRRARERSALGSRDIPEYWRRRESLTWSLAYIPRHVSPARRPVAVAVATLALFVPAATYAHTVGESTVKIGRWYGIKWKLTAGTWPDGSYCVAMTVGDGPEDGRGCGSIRATRISYMALTPSRRAPTYVVGPVIAKARSVRIKFFDRPPFRTSTIAPPPTLAPGTRFFLAILPCPATPRSVVARNAAGRIVARLVIAHRLGPKTGC
jgi:hypothetical protein